MSESRKNEVALEAIRDSSDDDDQPTLRQQVAHLTLGIHDESLESKQVVDLTKKRTPTPAIDDPWRIVTDFLNQDASSHDILLEVKLLKPPPELMFEE